MHLKMWLLGILICQFLGPGQGAEAGPQDVVQESGRAVRIPEVPRFKALIVGVAGTQATKNGVVKELMWAHEDALRVGVALRSLGYEVEVLTSWPKSQIAPTRPNKEQKIRSWLGSSLEWHTQATKETVLRALRKNLDELTRDDTFLFYFVGHGLELSNKNALVLEDTGLTWEGRDRLSAENILMMQDLRDDFYKSKVGQRTFVLDNCREIKTLQESQSTQPYRPGVQPASDEQVPGVARDLTAKSLSESLAGAEKSQSATVVFSCESGEQAFSNSRAMYLKWRSSEEYLKVLSPGGSLFSATFLDAIEEYPRNVAELISYYARFRDKILEKHKDNENVVLVKIDSELQDRALFTHPQVQRLYKSLSDFNVLSNSFAFQKLGRLTLRMPVLFGFAGADLTALVSTMFSRVKTQSRSLYTFEAQKSTAGDTGQRTSARGTVLNFWTNFKGEPIPARPEDGVPSVRHSIWLDPVPTGTPETSSIDLHVSRAVSGFGDTAETKQDLELLCGNPEGEIKVDVSGADATRVVQVTFERLMNTYGDRGLLLEGMYGVAYISHLLRISELDTAKTQARLFHQRFPSVPMFCELLAKVARQEGDEPEEIIWLERQLERDPWNHGAELRLGDLYERGGLREKAAVAYVSVIHLGGLDAVDDERRTHLVRLLQSSNQSVRAQRWQQFLYPAATASPPASPDDHALIVLDREKVLANTSRATSEVNWAVAQYNLAVALYNRALHLVSSGGSTEASALLFRAAESYRFSLEIYTLEARPKDWAQVHDGLGSVFHLLAQASDQGTQLKTALEHYRLAEAEYRRQGETGAADRIRGRIGLIEERIQALVRAEPSFQPRGLVEPAGPGDVKHIRRVSWPSVMHPPDMSASFTVVCDPSKVYEITYETGGAGGFTPSRWPAALRLGVTRGFAGSTYRVDILSESDQVSDRRRLTGESTIIFMAGRWSWGDLSDVGKWSTPGGAERRVFTPGFASVLPTYVQAGSARLGFYDEENRQWHYFVITRTDP